MSPEARTQRTERILTMRLEEVARALERSGGPRPASSQLLEQASVATSNAVALELLSAERARRIWRRAASRHSVLAGAGPSPPGPPVGPRARQPS